MKITGSLKAAGISALLLLGLSSSAWAAPGGGKDDQNAAPVNARIYAMERSKEYFAAFDSAYNCVTKHLLKEGEDEKQFDKFIKMKDCKPQVETFINTRFSLVDGPKLLFGNEQEEKTIMANAALISSYHLKLTGFFKQLMYATGNDGMEGKIVIYAADMDRWFKKYHDGDMAAMQDIDHQIEVYYQAKQRCKIASDHIECPKDAYRQMGKALNKLSVYFEFLVKSTALRITAKGIFLYDLNQRSRNYVNHHGDFVRIIDSARNNFKKRGQELLGEKGADLFYQIPKDSPFLKDTAKFPLKVNTLVSSCNYTFELLHKYMVAMKDGPIGKFLSQKELEEKTKMVAFDTDDRFTRTVRFSLLQHLLNTKDEKGNPVVHDVKSGNRFVEWGN